MYKLNYAFAEKVELAEATQPVGTSISSNLVPSNDWGWLPYLALFGASGLFVVNIAYSAARSNNETAGLLFWVGIFTLLIPVASRLLMKKPSRFEIIALLGLFSIELYLVKIFHSPTAFTFYDELLHWRTLSDIIQNNHLFLRNPLLPISSTYPGLEIFTNSIVNLSGLSIYISGVIAVGAGRLLLIIGLFLFYEEASQSSRLAGIATFIYMANPNFVFFDAQFSYESLALPLAVFVLYVETRRINRKGNIKSHIFWLIGGIAAVTITHHITSYVLTTFLIIWTIVSFTMLVLNRNRPTEKIKTIDLFVTQLRNQNLKNMQFFINSTPALAAILALSLNLIWMFFVAQQLITYVGGFLLLGVQEFGRLLSGELKGRELFQGYKGEVAPTWEQLLGYASVLIIVIGLPFGLWQIWKQTEKKGLVATLGITVIMYPVGQALRFTPLGLQVSSRLSEFIFLSVGFVLAFWLKSITYFKPQRFAIQAIILMTIFAGGIILGWPTWARMPGPYLVAADTRSIEQEGLKLADWTQSNIERNSRFAADRINGLLIGAYGNQNPISLAFDKVNVPIIYFDPEITVDVTDTIKQGKIRFIVVDRRLSTSIPVGGVYFELGEPDTNHHTTPLQLTNLEKFDGWKNAARIYDSGNLIIYDVGTNLNEK